MAFNVSLSGINAANTDLSVTANNVANVNTTGFKQSRAEFADLFASTSYGLSKNQTGSGVRVSNVAQQFIQGHNEQTGRSLDMAISGEGFFTMNMNGSRVYSRAVHVHGEEAFTGNGHVQAATSLFVVALLELLGDVGNAHA